MPSRIYRDELLRAYEYSFWLYQYISRKFKIEVEHDCKFTDEGKIEIEKDTHNPYLGSLAELLNNDLKETLNFIKRTCPSPAGDDKWENIYLTDRDIIQDLINAWHDREIMQGLRKDYGFYPLARPGAVWALSNFPPEVQVFIRSLHNVSLDYGFYAYALPCAQKSTSIFNIVTKSSGLSELSDKEEYVGYYRDWQNTYLKNHKEDYFFQRDFMPIYREPGQPGYAQNMTNSKKTLSYIWHKRNFKYNPHDIDEKDYWGREFLAFLMWFFIEKDKEDDEHKYALIWFIIDGEDINVDKTLNTIDRIVESLKIHPQEKHIVKPIRANGKQVDRFSDDTQMEISPSLKAVTSKQEQAPQIVVII